MIDWLIDAGGLSDITTSSHQHHHKHRNDQTARRPDRQLAGQTNCIPSPGRITGSAPMRASQSCTRCLTRLRPRLRPSERLLRPSFSIPRTISTLRTTTKPQWQNGPSSSLQSKRSFLSVFGGKKEGAAAPPLPSEVASTSDHPIYEHDESSSRVLLQPNNLFHIMEKSPSPSMRERAAAIKRTAYCPHPEHLQANSPQHVKYTCDACGVPTYCSEEHWAADYENHLLICDALKEANEDDHDLRSGRFFPEFEYPGGQMDEALINFTNWDTFLYTRDFRAINDPRSLRQVTKLLTYPITIASFLHELSPYSLRNRLTLEGLKSLSGITNLPNTSRKNSYSQLI